MAAVSIGATHTVVGELSDGVKLVFTDLVPDDGDAGTTVVTINPLTKIFAFHWGLKVTDASGSQGVSITPGGTVSGITTTSGNQLNVLTRAALTDHSGDMTITVMSIGV